MPIAGGILVAGSASRCLSSAAGMLRFLARLSGRRRHVRRSCVGPGGASCCGAVKATGEETGASSVSACVTSEGGSIGGDMGRPTIASAATTTTTMTTASTTTTTTTARARTTMTTTTTTTTTTSRTTTTMSSSLTSRLDEAAESARTEAWRNETIERIEDYTRTRETFVAGPDCTSCRENDRLTLADPLRDDKPHRATRQSEPNSQGSTTLLGKSRKDETKRPEGADNILEEAPTSRRQRPKNTRRSNKHSDIATSRNVDTVVNTATTTATTTTTTSFHTTTTTTSMRTRNDEDDDDDTAEHGSGEISHVRDTITRDRRKYRILEKDPVLEKERRETATERKRDSDNSSFSNTSYARRPTFPPYLATLLIISYTLFGIADACSSRSTPKPRPPTPTPRPNITFHMYTCPPDYAEWYCLNGATCFTVKIQESLLYNCLCANGFIGQRCEFKDLDGSYLPSRQRVMLETASIAGGATIAVFLVVIICVAAYIHCKRKQKELRTSSTCVDTVDGPGRDPELRPFSNRSRSLMIFMAKNPNGSTMSPSIEQTRMPGWSDFSQTETARMASVNEEKRGSSQ